MPLIHAPQEVQALYIQAERCGICLANFCTSNPYTTEAIIRAAAEVGRAGGAPAPVVISATGHYPDEPQLPAYTATGDALIGLQALVGDVRRLVSLGGPYADVPVMLHLDHGQPDLDEALFEAAADSYATLMYDASAWPMADNIRMTRAFVERMRGRVLVEGAVDELAQAGRGRAAGDGEALTAPEVAEHFVRETGVFLIVPNLGTEHRATGEVARYDGALAKRLSERLGSRIVLHGSSSLGREDLARLAGDGVVKVNVWTTFERVGAQAVARFTLRELGHILPEEELLALRHEGWIGEAHFAAPGPRGPTLSALRESARRDVWQAAVVSHMHMYLEHFGYARWPQPQEAK